MTASNCIRFCFPAIALLACACQTTPQNPSFPLSHADAELAMAAMADEPRALDRPLVIVGGFLDFGFSTRRLERHLGPLFCNPRVVKVALGDCFSFDDCRSRVIEAVQRAFPSDAPGETVEVDVIGVSMGGIVARYAAAPLPDGPDGTPARRLKIARLFTLASPHQGAALSRFPNPHPLARQMRHDAPFIRDLDEITCDAEYPIYAYTRLSDGWVGAQYAAPAGATAWWVPARLFQDSHMSLPSDARVLADIGRRLRDEPPFTSMPPAPLPQ